MTDVLLSGPADAIATLLLAHGAGTAMDSPWMTEIAVLLGDRGIRVARFEFAYMTGRRTGTRRPPPRTERLEPEYRDAVAEVIKAQVGATPLFIGGKSLGGRIASLVADELYDAGMIRGLVCLGYPFHPPGKPERLRTEHLTGIRTPTLVCQGTRDPFGNASEVPGYELAGTVSVRWFDGNHELTPLKSARVARPLAAVADAVADFVGSNAS
jgi:predicted alpha/beta-hydrolase family hydrolase